MRLDRSMEGLGFGGGGEARRRVQMEHTVDWTGHQGQGDVGPIFSSAVRGED